MPDVHKRSFDSLVGLKGLCIIIIVLYHTMALPPTLSENGILSCIKNYGGYLGNYMFFMLSGFLISYGYKERISAKKVQFKNYILKRLCKLYPLYLITNIAMLIIQVKKNGVGFLKMKDLILVLFLQKGGGLENTTPYNIPTWFISALFVCYIIYFVITYSCKNATQYKICLVAGIIWGYILLVNNWEFPFCYVQNGEAFLNFFLGCLLTEIYQYIKNTEIVKNVCSCIWIIALWRMCCYSGEVIWGDVRIVLSFLLCPMLIFVAIESKILSTFLSSNVIKYGGKISAAIFYWHIVILHVFAFALSRLGHEMNMYGLQLFVYFTLLLLVSGMSCYIEDRLIRFCKTKGA